MNNKDKEKTKERIWFLTIDQDAECYKLAESIAYGLNNCTFAMIYHDADDEKQKKHCHLVLYFDTHRVDTTVKQLFAGATLEDFHDLKKAPSYLLHDSKQRQELCKRVYHFDDIITDDPYALKYWFGVKKNPPFSQKRIPEYIVTKQLTNLAEFYIEFGTQVNDSVDLIKAILEKYFEYPTYPSTNENLQTFNKVKKLQDDMEAFFRDYKDQERKNMAYR